MHKLSISILNFEDRGPPRA